MSATNKTSFPRGFRGLCFDHGYYGRFSGPIPRFNPGSTAMSTFFLCGWDPATSLHQSRVNAAPSSRADAPVTADGRLANPAPRRLPRGQRSSCPFIIMSKRADGAAAARDDDDASPSGKSDDDEGSSGDGEPSSPLEPSEAFKRPRLASDARKPIQTRAREPRPLVWRDTAEESDAPQIAPQRPRRQPRAASPPPEASEAPEAPDASSEAPTPEFNSRTLDDPAAVLPSPPPPAPAAAPAAPPAAEATPTDAAAGAMARSAS